SVRTCDVEHRPRDGRGDGDGAREAGSVGQGRDRRPGDDAPRLGTRIAGGDEGDAGGERVAYHDRGGVRGPVVGDGDGVAEVLCSIHGGRPGFGEREVGDFGDGAGYPVRRVGAVVVGRVGVVGGGIGAGHVE